MIPAARLFSPHVDVLVPDLPGSGLSSRSSDPLSTERLGLVLGEWLDAVGVSRAVVLGNSYGASVAVACALLRPDLVVGAVLAGPTGDPDARSIGRYAARLVLDLPRERPSLWAIAVSDYLRFGPWRALRAAQEIVKYPLEGALCALTIPTLVLRGRADPIAPRAWVARAEALLVEGERTEVPGGHAAHHAHPVAFTAAVLEFLSARGLTGAGSPT